MQSSFFTFAKNTVLKKLLLVEDENHVVSFIKKGLSEEGYDVTVALDGQMGFDLFQNHEFDLVILDIMLPGMNGTELCKLIREKNKTIPIIFLTALGTTENIVMGLKYGADDYLVKPFKFIELTARIETLLRRANHSIMAQPAVNNTNLLTFADLVMDDDKKEVFRNNEKIVLTSTEYKLLHCFLTHKNIVLSRMDLLEKVWSINFNVGTNVVDVYVNYLRKKIDIDPDKRLIHTIVGMGYILKEST